MKAALLLVPAMLLAVTCGGPPTPAPDIVATRVAVELAVAATLTALAPAQVAVAPATPTAASTLPPSRTPAPSSTPTGTPAPLPTCTPVYSRDEKWEAVAKSNDIALLYQYLKENPATVHRPELQYLVDRFLRSKIDGAAAEGKPLIENATVIPRAGTCASGPFGCGAQMWLGGGYMELEGNDWYSDPTALLAVKNTQGGLQVVEGRGVVITGDRVYAFGLPPVPLEPSCQP